LDHPFPTVRAREITRWCESEDFQRIQRGLCDESSTLKCAKCGETIAEDWKFCRKCGQALR